MTIDIAYYISKIECLMGVATDRAKAAGKINEISPEDQTNILLSGALTAARELAKDIHTEVIQREAKSYCADENELQLLAFATIWSAWSAWIFKSKSEDPDPKRDSDRERAIADSKYVKSLIQNAMRGGENIGKGGGRPEGKKELIDIA